MFIRVKVFPNSKKELIVGKGTERFYVYTKEKAENGKANERVLEILAINFKLNKKDLVIIRGTTTPNKTIKVLNS